MNIIVHLTRKRKKQCNLCNCVTSTDKPAWLTLLYGYTKIFSCVTCVTLRKKYDI